MFSPKEYRLKTGGLEDWKNASHFMPHKMHRKCQEHDTHMATWKELELRSAKGLIIDKQEMALTEAER